VLLDQVYRTPRAQVGITMLYRNLNREIRILEERPMKGSPIVDVVFKNCVAKVL
jgi:hypothetical protein